MRPASSFFVSTILCAVLAAGCGGGGQNGLPGVQPSNVAGGSSARSYGRTQRPANAIVGVYVGQYQYPLLEYNYDGKGSPLCSETIPNEWGNIQSYSIKGFNGLIVPEYSTAGGGTIAIYNEGKTGRTCLPSSPTATFAVPGSPYDAFTLDGKIFYVGAATASGSVVEVCYQTRQRPGCRRALQMPPNGTSAVYGISGVTADSSGVYANVEYVFPSGTIFSLVYWPGAKGTGKLLYGKGLGLRYGSTISFDGLHNLLVMDGSYLDVYSGCPSACTLHGPFQLAYGAYKNSGSLGNGETTFMTVGQTSYSGGFQIDVYQYNGINGITYLYSNSAGINQNYQPLGIAQRLK